MFYLKSTFSALFLGLLLFFASTTIAQEKKNSSSNNQNQQTSDSQQKVPDHVQKWVDQLGSKDIDKRNKAVKSLLEMGPSVQKYLKQFKDHENPEIRSRIASILEKLEQQKLEQTAENGPVLILEKKSWKAPELIHHLIEDKQLPFKKTGSSLKEKNVNLSSRSLPFWSFVEEFCKETGTYLTVVEQENNDDLEMFAFKTGSLNRVPHVTSGSLWIQVRKLSAQYRREFPAGNESDSANKMAVELLIFRDPRVDIKSIDDVKITGARTETGEVLPPISDEEEEDPRQGAQIMISQLRGGGSNGPERTLAYDYTLHVKSPMKGGNMITELYGKSTTSAIADRTTLEFPLTSPDKAEGTMKENKLYAFTLTDWTKGEKNNTLKLNVRKKRSNDDNDEKRGRRGGWKRRMIRMMRAGTQGEVTYQLEIPGEDPISLTPNPDRNRIHFSNKREQEITFKHDGDIPEDAKLVVNCPNLIHEWTASWTVKEIPLPTTNSKGNTETGTDQKKESEKDSKEKSENK